MNQQLRRFAIICSACGEGGRVSLNSTLVTVPERVLVVTFECACGARESLNLRPLGRRPPPVVLPGFVRDK